MSNRIPIQAVFPRSAGYTALNLDTNQLQIFSDGKFVDVGGNPYFSHNVEWYVGNGVDDDFETLNEAIEEASKFSPKYDPNNEAILIKIILRTGYVIDKPIILHNQNLYFVEIHAEDEKVEIDRESFNVLENPFVFRLTQSSFLNVRCGFHLNSTGGSDFGWILFSLSENSGINIQKPDNYVNDKIELDFMHPRAGAVVFDCTRNSLVQLRDVHMKSKNTCLLIMISGIGSLQNVVMEGQNRVVAMNGNAQLNCHDVNVIDSNENSTSNSVVQVENGSILHLRDCSINSLKNTPLQVRQNSSALCYRTNINEESFFVENDPEYESETWERPNQISISLGGFVSTYQMNDFVYNVTPNEYTTSGVIINTDYVE